MSKATTIFRRTVSMTFLVLACSAAVVATAAEGQDPAQSKIPAIGDKAPDFTLQDLDGKEVTLSKLNVDSAVVLVVLRGYPGYQCPICSGQVGNLISRAKDFGAADAKVVLVYPGPAERLNDRAKEFIKSKTLPDHFAFVTDPDYKFTEAYGLRWDAPRETAYPSTFVVDRQGIVRFVKISKSHGDRAKADDLVQALTDGK